MSKLTFIKLAMLLCFVFGASNESWAVDYIYNIINNSGQLVMQVKGGDGQSGSKLTLPPLARTPFAKDYRYYKTLVEAQNDARYGKEDAVGKHNAVAYAENATIASMSPTPVNNVANIYVRYSYNASSTVKDNENKMVRIDGSVAYNLQVENRLVYYSEDTDSYTEPNKNITVTKKH